MKGHYKMEDEMLNQILGNGYEWDEYTICSAEFIDHLGDVLKEHRLKIEEAISASVLSVDFSLSGEQVAIEMQKLIYDNLGL